MLRIQFNNSHSMQQAEFKMINDATVQLTGKKIKPNTSGFKVFQMNGDFLGDYSEYTNIIESEKGSVKFGR